MNFFFDWFPIIIGTLFGIPFIRWAARALDRWMWELRNQSKLDKLNISLGLLIRRTISGILFFSGIIVKIFFWP